MIALANNELTQREQRRVRRHRAGCRVCRTKVALCPGALSKGRVGDRPFLFELIRHWPSLRQLMAGVILLAMGAGASGPIVYMVLRMRQQAVVRQWSGPKRPGKSAPGSRRSVSTRRVGKKTFHLIRGVWVDSQFHPDIHKRVIVCRRSEDDYRRLIKQLPQLAAYAKLGGRVLAVIESQAYWIVL